VTVHQKIRPKDVPGTLLNMALLNLGSSDPNLRTAAYNQLCALTATFDLKIEGQLLETSGKLLNVCVGQIVVMKVVKCLKLLYAISSFIFNVLYSACLGSYVSSSLSTKF